MVDEVQKLVRKELEKARCDLRATQKNLNTSGNLLQRSGKPSVQRWHNRCANRHCAALQRVENIEDFMRARNMLSWKERISIRLRRIN